MYGVGQKSFKTAEVSQVLKVFECWLLYLVQRYTFKMSLENQPVVKITQHAVQCTYAQLTILSAVFSSSFYRHACIECVSNQTLYLKG